MPCNDIIYCGFHRAADLGFLEDKMPQLSEFVQLQEVKLTVFHFVLFVVAVTCLPSTSVRKRNLERNKQ